MTIQQMMFAVMVFISTNSFTQYNLKDFAFDNKMHTKINGNSVFTYITLRREQDNPSYVFKHTRVIECTKDKKLKEIGTLGLLERTYELSRSYEYTRNHDVDMTFFYRFTKFARMNNAIYCADLEQKMNYYDELENVGAIVYGTRDVKDCALLREYLAQQELAAKK
jgi:hypothetical protein